MISLTMDQIRAAKDKDFTALGDVLSEMEERVCQIAAKAARGSGHSHLVEELEQIGRIAVWEGLARFNGNTVAEFFTFMDRTIAGHVAAERKRETRQGVSVETAALFESALTKSGGDPYEAERLAQSPELGKRKLSAELAYAARLAWSGRDSLDIPLGEDGATVGAFIADPDASALPDELKDDRDRQTERQQETRRCVRVALTKMGPQMRKVLCGTFGIAMDDVPYFGLENDDEFAAYLGTTKKNLQCQRPLGKNRFRVLYLAGATSGLVSDAVA